MGRAFWVWGRYILPQHTPVFMRDFTAWMCGDGKVDPKGTGKGAE